MVLQSLGVGVTAWYVAESWGLGVSTSSSAEPTLCPVTRALGKHSAVLGVGEKQWAGCVTQALACFLEASPSMSLSETSQQRKPVGSFWRGGFRGHVSS